eukprot:7323994-Alexandrium_andersonii.AAC.1
MPVLMPSSCVVVAMRVTCVQAVARVARCWFPRERAAPASDQHGSKSTLGGNEWGNPEGDQGRVAAGAGRAIGSCPLGSR